MFKPTLIVVSGSPGVGKSYTLNELRKKGYKVLDEPMRQKFPKEGWSAIKKNQEAYLNAQLEIAKYVRFEVLPELLREKELLILDRFPLDVVAFIEFHRQYTKYLKGYNHLTYLTINTHIRNSIAILEKAFTIKIIFIEQPHPKVTIEKALEDPSRYEEIMTPEGRQAFIRIWKKLYLSSGLRVESIAFPDADRIEEIIKKVLET